MKTRFRLICRGIRGGLYYCVDTTTGKRTSLGTTNEDEARQIIEAKNNSERLRRALWIRPVLEMRVPKTKIYVNSHSMKPRQFRPKATQEKKRIFITLDKGLSYFISLVYTEHGLALGTAFPPDGQWLRKMEANSMRISP